MPFESREELIGIIGELAETGIPGPGVASLIDVGTESFLNYFENEVLGDIVFSSGSTCKFVEGAYGSGKTHLLQLLHDLAVENQMITVRVELSQVSNFDDWRSMTSYILEKMETQVDGRSMWSLPRVLRTLDDEGIQEKDQKLRSLQLPHPGFLNAMMCHVRESEEMTSFAREKLDGYLTGERIGAGQLKKVGVRGVKDPLSKRNAEHVLNTVMSFLHTMGFPGTMILFDETDQMFHGSMRTGSKKVTNSANVMRRMIDSFVQGGVPGVVAVFAVLPDFLSACGEAYGALYDRVLLANQGREEPGWRSPVLRLEDINSERDPIEFSREIVNKFANLGEKISGRDNIEEELSVESRRILENHAGSDYRRALIKRLASKTLQLCR